MKIIKNKHYEKEFLENTKNEVSISKAAEDLKVAPKVIDYYITNDYGIVIFEKMDISLHDLFNLRILQHEEIMLIIDFILRYITVLHDDGIIHGVPFYPYTIYIY